MSLFLQKMIVTVFIAFFFLLFTFSSVSAAPLKGFEARFTTSAQNIVMEPGTTQTISLTFQNIGTTTWKNSGSTLVSIYTQLPKYRASIFRADSWKDYTQAAVLREKSVKPSETGTIELTLKAPKTEGTYSEAFQLSAENTAWIPGGDFSLKILVQKKGSVVVPVATIAPTTVSTKDGTISPVSELGLSATILLRSKKQISAEAGAIISYRVGLKNTGTTTWKTREIRSGDITVAATDTSSSTKLAIKTEGEVKPGSLDLIDFTFNAPSTKGLHTVRYQLAVDSVVVPDFFIDIPVEVTSGSPSVLASPLVDNPTLSPNAVSSGNVIDEPIMRIGVLIVDEETDWNVEISCNTAWKLIDGEGGLLGEMEKNQMVRAFYKNQRYYFNRGKGIEQTHQYLRFVPNEKDAVCKIENFDQRKTRRAGFSDNEFRDVLELRYNKAKDRTWIINELPIEEYLYGLAETSNDSHVEFKKTLLVAARTYAIYNWERATKHANEYFHMNNSADDQVYKGYGYEGRHPKIKEAVEETRGVTVNYQNGTALTPYFSRSDGRTRDWSEVWGGSVAWVKSVPAPCDLRYGRTLWGHGVGMSASEALCMAKEGGKTWKEILTYFYQGVELKKRW